MELKVARAEPEPGIAGSECSLSLRFWGSAQVQHLHLGSGSYGVTLLLKWLVTVPNSGCPRWGFLCLLPRIRQGGNYGIVFPLCSISSSQHPTFPVPSRTCQSPRVCFGANGFRKVPINLSCSSALLGMLLALLASTALRGGFSIPVTKIYFVQAFSYAGERKGGKATWNQLSAQWKLAWPGWGARGDSGLFPTNCCGDKHS